MLSEPSERQLEMQRRVAHEESRDRRTIARVQLLASGVLVASTLLAWMNHPRVVHRFGTSPSIYVREVSHSIGLVTRPAGVLALFVGVVAIASARQLRRPRVLTGWLAVGLAAIAVGVCTVEIVQLLLGRRNWLSDLSTAVAPSPTGNAIGVGVWIAAAASIGLMANALTYLFLEYRHWRNSSVITEEEPHR